MGDRFRPISMEQLTDWVFDELESKDSIFGVPRSAFFVPDPADRFRVDLYGTTLETPFGVAAGPHTQMAQNIIVSWLVRRSLHRAQDGPDARRARGRQALHRRGGRGLQRRVVAGAQGLRVVRRVPARLGAASTRSIASWASRATRPGVIFNMSVGYNLEGIRRPNVQWYLDTMADASAYLPTYLEIVAARCPESRAMEVPSRVSDTITLSTMHGCPPDEIERISLYLLEERKLHTSVKCNPTLLGAGPRARHHQR